MAFTAGQQVGDYEILQILGVGGLGAVYKARHRISRRCDALKIALPERMESAEMEKRFEREIQLLAGLDHPNIARLYSAFYHGDQLVMVIELVEGEDLRTRSRRVPIALPALLSFSRQVLAALGYAHTSGVVHRDVKPANIMITAGEQIKVLDFGIATGGLSGEITATGALIGSVNYMSPEQISGRRATAQSDVYAFGITLFELITGELPLRAATSFEMMQAHMQQTPRALSELRPDVPASLAAAIARALAKQPQDRFASAQEMLRALESSSMESATASYTTTAPAASRSGSTGTGASTTEPLSPELEQVRSDLAQFIGPIAKVVVRRLAPRCQTVEQLYLEASREIATESERQRFLGLRAARRR